MTRNLTILQAALGLNFVLQSRKSSKPIHWLGDDGDLHKVSRRAKAHFYPTIKAALEARNRLRYPGMYVVVCIETGTQFYNDHSWIENDIRINGGYPYGMNKAHLRTGAIVDVLWSDSGLTRGMVTRHGGGGHKGEREFVLVTATGEHRASHLQIKQLVRPANYMFEFFNNLQPVTSVV